MCFDNWHMRKSISSSSILTCSSTVGGFCSVSISRSWSWVESTSIAFSSIMDSGIDIAFEGEDTLWLWASCPFVPSISSTLWASVAKIGMFESFRIEIHVLILITWNLNWKCENNSSLKHLPIISLLTLLALELMAEVSWFSFSYRKIMNLIL